MKRTLFGALTLLVVALAVSTGFAQSKNRADVPFAFSVGDNALPQGTYTLIEVSDRVMRIRNEATNESVMIVAQYEEDTKPQAARLVFHKYGDRYFLAEAWTGAGGDGIEFPAGSLEKEIRTASAKTGGVTDVVIALR
jgi:hypothetical protein